MRKYCFYIAATVALAACATAPEPVVESEPALLSDTAFWSLWNAAYNSEPKAESEQAFAALLARDDLTDLQRGETYYGRGTLRGIWVRDWPEAYPQCALGDLLKAVEYPLSDARRQQAAEGIFYQYDRRGYFPNRPEACEANVPVAAAWLDASK